ncbi:MAG TPA: SRPBCC domain-containing protein [bacterium]|nr:SRPBCC domain-containing protein [bacterium]
MELSKMKDKVIVFKRTFQAPRALVFEAFTKPEHVKNWWPPKPYTMPVCTMDLKVGGAWHYVFRSPEGQEHPCDAIYEVVEPPAKLVMTQAVPMPDGKPFFKIRQTITFEEKDGATALTFEVRILEANPGSEPFLGGMEQGTNMTLDNLAEYLAGKK